MVGRKIGQSYKVTQSVYVVKIVPTINPAVQTVRIGIPTETKLFACWVAIFDSFLLAVVVAAAAATAVVVVRAYTRPATMGFCSIVHPSIHKRQSMASGAEWPLFLLAVLAFPALSVHSHQSPHILYTSTYSHSLLFPPQSKKEKKRKKENPASYLQNKSVSVSNRHTEGAKN